MKKRILAGIVSVSMIVCICAGCQNEQAVTSNKNIEEVRENESQTEIELKDDEITASTHLVAIEGNVVKIIQAGSYVFTGELSDGRIVVEADKEDAVELVLNGVDITCSDYAPIQVLQADNVTINLAEESVNVLTDGSTYSLADEEDNTDGVIFSKDDLEFKGNGTLYINGNYKHGIVGKDDVTIHGGTYVIQAVEDGVNANDSITIEDGDFTIAAGDDGIHVDELLTINAGIIMVAESTEGLEGHQVIINGGDIDITASDDGINSNSGSDSENAELNVTMEAGGAFPETVEEGSLPERPEDETFPEESERGNILGGERGQGRMGGMTMDADEDSLIQINGGTIQVDANGDGLDSNGYLEINGGAIYISGSVGNGDSAIDYGLEATISGGSIVAAGFSGMAETFSSESQQYSIQYKMQDIKAAGTSVVVRDSSGAEILSFTPGKEYNCLILSSPEMEEGERYTIEIDGNTEEL
ncbi:MAG: carbohydrate-binding domain-containing protein [Lachnospiraceae bacterium]|nr:carbohydrate-binding domain-containing protein [Lachnospiraceae bacterium]